MPKNKNGAPRASKKPDAGTWYDQDLVEGDDAVIVIPSPKEEAAFHKAEKEKHLNWRYKRDMYALKLPLPLFFWSDREREAHVLNQCENAKHGKLIRHFKDEQNMANRRLRQEAKLVRTQASKIFPNFYAPDLAKRRTKSAPPLSPKENGKLSEDRPMTCSGDRGGSRPLQAADMNDSDSNGGDDEEIDPFIAEFNTMFENKDSDDDDSETVSRGSTSIVNGAKCWRTTPSATPLFTPAPKNTHVAFSNSSGRSQSAFAMRKDPPNMTSPDAARCQSAMPPSKTDTSLCDTSHKSNVKEVKRNLRERRPSYHDPIKNAYLLKQELRRNTKRRQVEPPKTHFDIKQEVQNEKTKFKNIQDRIHVYVEELKEFQKPQLNKWSVKEFESKLQLKDTVETTHLPEGIATS